ncbi:hypothetical protein OAO55_03045 [Bacteroidales bacterium]|nr:hypothetical protein [Bacteroidales bacterium]
MLWFKLVIAKIFNIDYIMHNFTLWGKSASNSGVWGYKSVLSFYSVEIFILLGILILTLILGKIAKRKKGFAKFIIVWFHIMALVQLLAIVAAGILTRNNIFHFLHWTHMPVSIILAIGFVSLFLSFLLGVIYNVQVMKYRPSNKHKKIRNYFGFIRIYGITTMMPALLGLVLLYITHLRTILKYDKVEIASIALFFVSGLIFLGRTKDKRRPSDSITTVNKTLVIVAAGLYFAFTAIRLF